MKAVLFICAGFFIGGLLGAKFASPIPGPCLKRIFAGLLMALGLKMLF